MSAIHVAGHPALDFIGTLSERGATDYEELVDTTSLSDWFVDAALTTTPPEATTVDLEAAHILREQLFVVVTAWMCEDPYPPTARETVNIAAAVPPPQLTLAPEGQVIVAGTMEACLSALARSTLELMAHTKRTRVRSCADQRCTHLFLDTSRAQARRWCDMSTCGTRNKQRDHRARKHSRHRENST